MSNDATKVTVGKPKAGGAVFVAPASTTLPTDASTALGGAFVCLGYISEDGVVQTNETDSSDFKAWGGDTVLTVQTSSSEQYQMTFIEQNVDVLKQVYGAENVTGSWASGISIKHNSKEKAEYVYVVETVMSGTMVDRLVIPRGKVIEIGDVTRKDDELMAYETTIKALVDSSGNTSYEYMANIAGVS